MTRHSLLLVLLAAGKCLAEVAVLAKSTSRATDLSTGVDIPRARFLASGSGSLHDDLSLLDIVLVASVDGKLHALNRTSGDTIWSMAASEGTVPATLGPLVRTQHPDIDRDLFDDDSVHQAVYVVEPQSGDIYVMSSPDSPLHRLPFSMPQLVDMSPFSFSGGEENRLFIGKKESSLLLIELETGRVKAILDSECPWDPFQDLAQPAEFELDLDELDGTKPPKLQSTEVYIGRTDYHVSIHTRSSRSSITNPPVQRLSFSVYGPNNQDLGLQTFYRHTADDAYIQPLPSGEILSFKSANIHSPPSGVSHNAQLLWGQSFANPIVAVFDVLREPKRDHPFVLLQPRLQLEDIFPNSDFREAAAHSLLPNRESAYVGLVESSGSLFAMSPSNFPLIVFGDVGVDRLLDASSADAGDTLRNIPRDLDLGKLRKLCQKGSTDLRCLTGVRKLESSSKSSMSGLLDGAPSVPLPPGGTRPIGPHVFDNTSGGVSSKNSVQNESMSAKMVWDSEHESHLRSEFGFLDASPPVQAFSAFVLCTLLLLVVFVWATMRKNTTMRATLAHGTTPAARPEMYKQDSTAETLHGTSNAPPSQSGEDVAEKVVMSRPSTPIRPQTPGTVSKKVAFLANGNSDDWELIRAGSQDDIQDEDDSDKDGDVPTTPGKRKGLRRKRGKKKKGPANGNAVHDDIQTDKEDGEKEGAATNGDPTSHVAEMNAPLPISPSTIVLSTPPSPGPVVPSLMVSDTVLGFGSHGTVVFKGSLQGRAVAVKRLLQDFVTLASREVTILQESDDHPNVIRYYYQESQGNFLYIALELCPASLADVIERPCDFQEIVGAFEPKRALRQITAGLRHLHALKIIHRDIKPQNILVSHAKKGIGESAGHRMLISDFGLCRKLEIDQTSFLPTAHGAMAAGTAGWRAPEILRGEVKLDESGGDESQSSRSSVGSSSTAGTPTGKPTRLTKSVDIFALGCLYYYVLTSGGHPFGDRFEREINILKNAKSLEGLQHFGEEGSEGTDLITRMLCPEACDRPDTSTCLLHPYFWNPGKRLNFLQDVSDRFEIMCRDPRDLNLTLLETNAFNVVGSDWHSRLDKLFIENLGKFRKYDGKSVQDLLRALRNKQKHHYQDLPDNVKRLLGSMPEGFLAYFTRRFPHLFLHVHSVVSSSPLRTESMFRTYFELSD
ncbi:uncharacterized protein FIBRA_08847 [Fibroporia radiculosa]|uniref:non-specific serine/threonine protein kinase n=1 Tax=Fibroporia radiculosa TaxID=599839 RepID=J4GXI0_9APHY|nr:uncharacterized protein FIBRA_08847 [Fibroporia radiculosa]CCM06570.1 predicted protein [Fibroporia radiculosa]